MFVQGCFSVGVYKYARPGCLYDWIVVFKVSCGESYESQVVIEDIAAASQKDPILLSRRETSDYVTSIQSQTGVNKKLASGILQVMMSDRTHLTYADTAGSKKILYSNIQSLIIQGDNFNGGD